MSLYSQLAAHLRHVLGATGGQRAPLASLVLEMLSQGGSGGLSSVVQAFQTKGLGDIVASWVSTSPNLPISPAQIQEALGSASIQQIAQKAGLSPEATSAELARILPEIVDTLTPRGKLPAAGALEHALGLLKNRLG